MPSPGEPKPTASAPAPPPAGPAIRLHHVTLRRGTTTILDRLDWTVHRGQAVALLGPNGSGKTTLTRVITGYEWPTTGVVDVLDERLGHTDVRQLRRRVQIVNPSARYSVDPDLRAVDAVLTGYTASLYLYEPPNAEQRDRAEHLLRIMGLAHRLDQRFGLLSTGEQRRALLARALVRLPEILILDEPTAGLDVPGREHLLATIDQLHRLPDGPTLITVTHHVEEISPSTEQVLLLKAGRALAVGPPDRVINPETLSRLFDCKVFVQKRSGRYWLEVLPEAWIDLLKGRRLS
jgi:iron complex transport system ATP-binding protein